MCLSLSEGLYTTLAMSALALELLAVALGFCLTARAAIAAGSYLLVRPMPGRDLKGSMATLIQVYIVKKRVISVFKLFSEWYDVASGEKWMRKWKSSHPF